MFSTDYELALVANLFHKPNNINKVRGMLLGSEFYSNDLGIAFTKLIDMNNAGLPINKVTLETELKKSGKANNLTALIDTLVKYDYLTNLQNTFYIGEIHKSFIKRHTKENLILATKAIDTNQSSERVDEILRYVDKLKDTIKAPESCADLLEVALECVERNLKGFEITTGITELDYLLTLSRKKFVVIGAETSSGKTSFAIHTVLQNLSRGDSKIGYFTYDMSAPFVVLRLAAAGAGIPAIHASMPVKFPDAQENLKIKTREFIRKYESTNKILVKGFLTLNQIERELACDDYSFIVIDYIQTAINRNYKTIYNRAETIGNYCAELKAIADKYNVCIIGLSQFNRPAKQPGQKIVRERQLSDLLGSSSIEQSADVVALFSWEYRFDKEANKNKYLIDVAKNNMGITDRKIVHFDPILQVFRAWDAADENLIIGEQPNDRPNAKSNDWTNR
jgi:replicative DNA helicase